MTDQQADVAVIGAGIVGSSVAMSLSDQPGSRKSVVLLEAEDKPAAHQTGHNSGVIHSGLYYLPGSQKAQNCVDGRKAMYQFCRKYDLPHEQCGKLVVATREEELGMLHELEQRGRANGLEGVKKLNPSEMKEIEPHCQGLSALLVPETGIVDYIAVCNKFVQLAIQQGCELRTRSKLTKCIREQQGLVLETTSGRIRCKNLINCAGLQSDRVARLCGVNPGLKIIPFRGDYQRLKPHREFLVKNLIYPVPDPKFPFLGVHWTRMIHGGVEAGPNAVLAFRREGYRKGDMSIKDIGSYWFYGGFWKMAMKYWLTGMREMARSFNKNAFVREARKLVPEVTVEDVEPADAGVRAQALLPDGKLADDFRFVQTDRMIHVLNAPSPAATASISIGRTIAAMARKQFES